MGGVAVLNPQDYDNNLFSTPLKSRRTPKPNPNLTRSDNRKRSPPAGLRKNKSTTAMVVDPPATAAAKNLVMGQVKILKRGEPFGESLSVLKSSSDQNITNGTKTTITTTMKEDRKVSGRRVLPTKKKENKKISNTTNYEELKIDDFALSSTDRLGPEPEMVPKKKNNMGVFFAGSVFVDSPPPSSVPLPGFFTKKEDPSTDLQRILGLNL